jgi:hypothetical protein
LVLFFKKEQKPPSADNGRVTKCRPTQACQEYQRAGWLGDRRATRAAGIARCGHDVVLQAYFTVQGQRGAATDVGARVERNTGQCQYVTRERRAGAKRG